MSFQTMVGQTRAKQMLQNSLKNDKISHAYIFSGPAGSGRHRAAAVFAKAIFCSEMQDDACGQCLECRKADHDNHPNLQWIQPDGSTVKIDQIRNLQKDFSYKGTSGQKRIYIISEADRMTPQASNSLLKFLEEPQSDTVAILITDNGHALLPTIRSRAQWIPFVPMAPGEMLKQLVAEGVSPVLARPAVHLAAGIDAARELTQLNWFAEIRNVMIQLAKESASKLTSSLITAQQKVAKTELGDHMHILFDLFLLWHKDLIYIQTHQKQQIVFVDQLDWLEQHAFTREMAYWVRRMELAVEMQKRLRGFVNPQLALEQFMIGAEGG